MVNAAILIVSAEAFYLKFSNVSAYIKNAKASSVPTMMAVALNDPIAEAVELMRKFDVSQLPVVEERHVLGTVHDDTISGTHIISSFNQPESWPSLRGERLYRLSSLI